MSSVPIDSIRPYEGNPRRGDIARIRESLRENGQYKPIIVREETDEILVGNHTWLAAQAEGWQEIWVERRSVPDDRDARRILVVDNRTSDLAGYEDEELAAMLRGLEDDYAGSGYTDEEVGEFLANLEAANRSPDDAPTDDPPPLPAEPRSKTGDLYLLGEHRLLCGDSGVVAHLDRVFTEAPGVVLTDPPYGIKLDTDYSKITGSKRSMFKQPGTKRTVVAQSYRPVEGDTQPFDASFLRTYFAGVDEQFWWGANYYRRTLSDSDLDGAWMVWDKRPAAWVEGSEGIDDAIGAGFELLWSSRKHQQRVLRHQWSGFTARNVGLQRAHPTEKSVVILADVLERWSAGGCVVADPFLGSGTTLMACEQTGRRCFGLELDPRYVDVERWQQHTGQEAKLDG